MQTLTDNKIKIFLNNFIEGLIFYAIGFGLFFFLYYYFCRYEDYSFDLETSIYFSAISSFIWVAIGVGIPNRKKTRRDKQKQLKKLIHQWYISNINCDKK